MHDPTAQLVKMANQIGSFFEAQTPNDPATARLAIVGHLKSFWAPSMRRQLMGELDAGGAGDLMPIVALAVRSHRDKLVAAAQAHS
ncbi:formate dehydrogenase subunit delta [Variovorax sp. KK3]|uniref:formate dehydrogenase subunit delta n=1 Tax=Variovorax sp. KK3 TaxID=1855728 RepID=UPI00097BBC8B|nr:formate dehydrogenase subunit delta [Variovorax sp. KK3]